MTIYILLEIAILFMLCLHYRIKSKEQVNKISTVIIFIMLVLIIGLRHPSMGHDLRYGESNGYLGSFNIIANMSWSKVFSLQSFLNYEYGFILYCKLVGAIWNNQQFFIFVSAFLSLLPVFVVIYKKSTNSIMSSLIYLGLPAFLMVYSGIRQALAIGFGCLAIDLVQRKKLIRFILLVTALCFIHYSAFTLFIAYPIYYLKISKKTRWIMLLVIPVVYVLRYQLFDLFSKLFKEDATTYETGAYTLLLVFCAIYVFCIVFCKDGDLEQNGYMNLFFLACIFQTFGPIYDLAMREGYYFMIILVVLLPSVISNMKMKTNNVIAGIAVSASFAIYALYAIYSSTWAMAYPHYFFWESIMI